MPRKIHTLASAWEDFAVRRRSQVRERLAKCATQIFGGRRVG